MDEKPWYQSRTIWGVIISLIGKVVAGVAGIEISETDTAQVTDSLVVLISASISVFGDLMAIYGRKKATTSIK